MGEKSDKGRSVQVELEKGNKKLFQVDSKIKADMAATKFDAKVKYVLLGTISGSVQIKYDQGTLSLKNTDSKKNTMELWVTVVPGQTLSIEGKKNGESMWTYKSTRTTNIDNTQFETTLDTDMTLNSNSEIYKFPKFKLDAHLEKDGAKAVDLTVNAMTSPYKFQLTAPNFFNRWGLSQPSIDVTVDHKPGSSIVIDANILGGLHLEAKRGKNAKKEGRYVNVLAKKGGEQMFKLDITYKIVNNKKAFKFTLHDTFEVNTESVLYKNLISKYKFLTPFTSRTGDLEFFFNKKEKNVLLKKFYIKGKVEKDGSKAAEIILTTDEKPYKFELFAPAFLTLVKSGMTEAKVTVEHNPGELLNVVTNFEKFKGFKISKTGSGNEREIEINGKKLVTGDYVLTDNHFSTKISLGSDWIEPKITWEGKLPNSQAEAEAFFLKNNIQVHVTGSKRNLDLSLNWKTTKPDFNFGTPENGKLSLNAKGHNPRWGDYSLSRDINWNIESKVIEVNEVGSAEFAKGLLAPFSPIETDIKFKLLLDEADLIGKFMKKFKGKEYSIDFPKGSGAFPKISMGM